MCNNLSFHQTFFITTIKTSTLKVHRLSCEYSQFIAKKWVWQKTITNNKIHFFQAYIYIYIYIYLIVGEVRIWILNVFIENTKKFQSVELQTSWQAKLHVKIKERQLYFQHERTDNPQKTFKIKRTFRSIYINVCVYDVPAHSCTCFSVCTCWGLGTFTQDLNWRNIQMTGFSMMAVKTVL